MNTGINLRTFITVLFLPGFFASCFPKMSNDPAPPPMKWYSFPVSGFQLKDALDSFVKNNTDFFYDPLFGNEYRHFRMFTSFGKDTILYLLYISGDARAWVTQPDSTHLALFEVRKGKLAPDSLTRVIFNDTLDHSKKKQYHDIFSSKVIEPLRVTLQKSARYSIRPLNVKDTIDARWIICRGGVNVLCDTSWLTSTRRGQEYILSDSGKPVPSK